MWRFDRFIHGPDYVTVIRVGQIDYLFEQLADHVRVVNIGQPLVSAVKIVGDLLVIQAEQGFAVVFVTHSVYESVSLADRVLLMSPSPGRIHEEIRIEPGGPRGEAFRNSVHYGEQCVAVSRALRRAVEGVAARSA